MAVQRQGRGGRTHRSASGLSQSVAGSTRKARQGGDWHRHSGHKQGGCPHAPKPGPPARLSSVSVPGRMPRTDGMSTCAHGRGPFPLHARHRREGRLCCPAHLCGPWVSLVTWRLASGRHLAATGAQSRGLRGLRWRGPGSAAGRARPTLMGLAVRGAADHDLLRLETRARRYRTRSALSQVMDRAAWELVAACSTHTGEPSRTVPQLRGRRLVPAASTPLCWLCSRFAPPWVPCV